MAEQILTLKGFKSGALEERFARELQRVLHNIRDPMTPRDALRSITVRMTFKPAEDRQFAAVQATVTSKLAPDKPINTFTLFDTSDDEQVVAIEQIPNAGEDPRQREIAAGAARVTPIDRRKTRKDPE